MQPKPGLAGRRRRQGQQEVLPRASVLVPLFIQPAENTDEPQKQQQRLHVLLTKRPMHLTSHPGEVCFPGGRQDAIDDGNDIETALRETWEEIGLDRSHIQPLCQWAPIISRNGLCVTPIVAWIPSAFQNATTARNQLQLSPQEVEHIFDVPLDYFLERHGHLEKKFDVPWPTTTTAVVSPGEKHNVGEGENDNDNESEDTNVHGHFCVRSYYFHDTISQETFHIWGLTAHVIYQVACWAIDGTMEETPGATIATSTALLAPATTRGDVHSDNNRVTHERSEDDDVPRGGGGNESIQPPPLATAPTTATATTAAATASATATHHPSMQGPLRRWNDDHHYWSRYYYVLVRGNDINDDGTGGGSGDCAAADVVLHQYASFEQAHQKSFSATKKNRLRLLATNTVRMVTTTTTTTPGHQYDDSNNHTNTLYRDDTTRFPFEIHVLDGRIQWRLAAASAQERQEWMEAIVGCCRTMTTGGHV